ncbi:MAG TPA: hypothetical protein DDZ51_18630, partial [Planctomycetaceae bacterium]|nr:hypothetical protein [Planctomycetaceae bacterium]
MTRLVTRFAKFLRFDSIDAGGRPHRQRCHPSAEFASILIRTPNENSVLTLEAPKKRESESSGPIFRTGGCNLEGCIRETEISPQTESAADWAGETRKALETREKLGRNEKRPAVDLSTPG